MFSSLESAVTLPGARVLDLFAGSGALGLEAASRGAREVVLVDSSSRAVDVMRRNLAVVGLPGVQVVKRSVEAYVQGSTQTFDVVLLDPPYDVPTGQVEQILNRLTQGWLVPEAVVVVERGADDITWPTGYEQDWHRRFGGTHVTRAVWYGHDQEP